MKYITWLVLFFVLCCVFVVVRGCTPEPTCTEKAMAQWREQNPKAGSGEASYRYRRAQQGCGEN